MIKQRETSTKAASDVIRDGRTGSKNKAAAGSALSQRDSKKKRSKKK